MRWRSRAPLIVAIAFIAVAPFLFGGFTITLMNYIGIYALAALGLVLLTGVGGLTSFGQAAFVGIGAYATAWYTATQGGSPWIGLILALVLTGLVATCLGAVTLRLSGHFLPLSTIAWGIAIYFVFGNLDALNRYSGLSGIPPISLGPISLEGTRAIYYFIWIVLGLVMLLCHNLLDSRQGRAIRSLRGGIAMVESLAIDSFRMRLAVFVLAGLLAGLSGWLFAHMQRFVNPTPFDIRPGIEFLFMALLGGAGQIAGAVVGAAIVVLLKNLLQDILPPITRYSAQLEIVLFGILLIVILQKARGGVVPLIRRFLPRSLPAAPVEAPPLAARARPAVTGEPLLRIEAATKRFGALAAVNEVSFEVRPGEVLGPDRTEWRRQDHAAQSHHRHGEAEQRQDRVPRRRRHAFAAAPDRGEGHGADVPARQAAAQHEPDRQRGARRLSAHARRASSPARSGSTAPRSARHGLRRWRSCGASALAEKFGELAGNLPLGQQRLLEVARALAASPVVVILDEPAAGLRALEKKILSDLLKSLRKDGMTIVLVEHDMDFVMNLVDRIVVMDFGAKITEGLPAEIRADARVQEAYLGGVA